MKKIKIIITRFLLYFLKDTLNEMIKQSKDNTEKYYLLNAKEINKLNTKQDTLSDLLLKLRESSITMGLDISMNQHDSTQIIVMTRGLGKEHVEFIDARFNNYSEVLNFIKETKSTFQSENIRLDIPLGYRSHDTNTIS